MSKSALKSLPPSLTLIKRWFPHLYNLYILEWGRRDTPPSGYELVTIEPRYTIAELKQLTGWSVDTIYNYHRRGTIKALPDLGKSGSLIFTQAALDTLLKLKRNREGLYDPASIIQPTKLRPLNRLSWQQRQIVAVLYTSGSPMRSPHLATIIDNTVTNLNKICVRLSTVGWLVVVGKQGKRYLSNLALEALCQLSVDEINAMAAGCQSTQPPQT